jgi:DNA-binding YbaB/EbfC family protein
MFKEIGQLASLMRNLPKLQQEAEQLKQKLSQIVAEGSAGAGMVTVRVNGHMEVLSCRISEDALKDNDREMLEDLIKAATNQALQKSRQLVAEETTKMATGLGLPAGMNIPGT